MKGLLQKLILGGTCVTMLSFGMAPQTICAAAAGTAEIKAVDSSVQGKLQKAPVLTIAEKGYDSVKLTWNAVAGAATYTLQQTFDKKTYTDVVTLTDKDPLSCELTGLYTNQKSYYRVIAADEEGRKVKSKRITVKPVMQRPVAEFSYRTYKTVNIRWTEVPGADFYRVYRSLTPVGGYKSVKTVYGTSCYNTVQSGVTYYYKIMPLRYNPDGKKAKGTCSVVQKVCLNLDAPALESVKNGTNNSLVISWTGVDGAAGYGIYRSTSQDKDFVKIADTEAETTTWTDTTVDAGTQYFYKVCARTGANGTESYGAESMIGSCWTQPAAPLHLSAAQGGNGVHLTWDAVTGATEYKIYRAKGDSTYTLVGTVTEPVYDDNSVISDTTYSYKVAAVHDAVTGTKSTAVSVEVSSIKTSTRTLFLGPGVKKTLKVTTQLEGTPVFNSENPEIAVVDEKGVVKGVGPGTTNVTVNVSGVTATVRVNVTDCEINGIDVSKWQQAIDWKKVKASGIKFAMLRLAHKTKDVRFEEYYAGAVEQGIDVGVYCYSMATSAEEGREEAQWVLELLEGRPLTYPIALDLEDQVQLKKMNTEERTDLILAYKEVIEEAGYDFIVYSNLYWLNNYIDNERLAENDVDIWIARYRNQSLGYGYEGGGTVRIWQYTSSGQIDGILDEKGNYINVDLDVCYVPYE